MLDRCHSALAPLGEPLAIGIAAHRALRLSREEVFSDWLAWTLERIGDLRSVLAIVGVSDPFSVMPSRERASP